MTLSEAQTLRASVFQQYQNVLAGGVESYGINGRNVVKISPDKLLKQLNQLDLLILRLSGQGCPVAQFRGF